MVFYFSNHYSGFPDSAGASMWSTKDGRRNWEKEFVNVFVNPFWKVNILCLKATTKREQT